MAAVTIRSTLDGAGSGCRGSLKTITVGPHPEWLTIPADGKNVYVAVAGEDATVVVDAKTMRAVKKIAVGAVPKRNTSGVLMLGNGVH
jgi:YVTN family beta-propeller protein